MNERIRELSEQAANEYLSEMESATDTLSTAKRNELAQKAKQAGIGIIPHGFSEKFAELIINECIDQVAGTKIVGQLSSDEFGDLSESARNKYKQWNNALVIATMNVRDHFGIKE
jgi:hypothetical protein